ncbi:MAG: DUF4974 domain-containing protein [Muribaculaceae bacterium]|nr:DUF4974 domain-containing protein [Muribaculaceae bacterium]
MKKTEHLLEMLEHPERYNETQWQEILADDECHELYSMMAKTKGAFAAENADADVSDEMIENEWQRLSSVHNYRANIVPLWRKIAVAAAIVIAFFGITIAAVQTNFFGLVKSSVEEENNKNYRLSAVQDDRSEATLNENTSEQNADTIALTQPHLYDNVPLEQILNDLSAYYNVTVEYRNAYTRSLRLYYEWQPDYTLDKVLEMLNNFESFCIYREDNNLIVESSNPQKGK